MIKLSQHQAAQIAHHEQDVGIDRVRMEQVVLHAPDDAAERRDVAPEHAVVVHAPQLVRHAMRGAQDLEKQPMVARVLAELLIDQREIAHHRANGVGAHPADLWILLQQHEQLEQRRGVARKHIVAHRLQIVVADLKARIQRLWRLVAAEDRLAEQLQQQLIEHRHVDDRAVIALHQLLDCEGVAGVLVVEALGELDLIIEQQPVLVPARQHMQAEAHLPQERLRLLEPPQLRGGEEALRHQLIERLGAEVPPCDPTNRLNVAQTAGSGLYVRLEVVGGIVGLEAPLLLLLDLGLEILAR